MLVGGPQQIRLWHEEPVCNIDDSFRRMKRLVYIFPGSFGVNIWLDPTPHEIIWWLEAVAYWREGTILMLIAPDV